MLLSVTCPPGFSQTTKKELAILGYKNSKVISPSLVLVETEDESSIAYLNVWLRSANKVSLMIDSQTVVEDFDQFFEHIKTLDRSHYVAPGQEVLIYAFSKNSALHHTPSLQSLSQKAIFSKLSPGRKWITYPKAGTIEVEIVIIDNLLNVSINSSGSSLYRRGYRQEVGDAPLKETIAAGLVLSLGWKFSEVLLDPYCGSGTIAIEAALIAKNIAPGLQRKFAFESWRWYNSKHLSSVKKKSGSLTINKNHRIYASDYDQEAIEMAQRNAERAGVEEYISWAVHDATLYKDPKTIHEVFEKKESDPGWFDQFSYGEKSSLDQPKKNNTMAERFCVLTNPPYGERLKPQGLENMYRQLIRLLGNEGMYGGFISLYNVSKKFDMSGYTATQIRNGAERVQFWKKKFKGFDI